MCGLVFSTATQPARSSGWRRAMEVLECRGPDAQGEVHTDAYSAGHCRLEIIGLGDVGRQPYSANPAEDLLLFNGEIYNYRVLASSLGIAADSDTHVLYHLLHSGQVDRLSELRGMFAFVYWHADSNTITTGRDLFGIKPLYVARAGDGSLSFASVPAALLPLADHSRVDPAALAGFLATGYFPSGTSPYAEIEKCPEGTITTWHSDGSAWTAVPTPLRLAPEPARPVLDAVRDSVAAHLVSDVPVGVLLSGGVDSTLIAACAAAHVDEISTFSLVNPSTPAIDESSYARWNAGLLGARHVEVPFDSSNSMDVMRSLVRATGEPFGDAAYLPLAVLCRHVARDLKVVLAGEGADELFGGYRRYDVERMRRGRLTGPPLRGIGRMINGGARYQGRAPSSTTRSWAHWSEPDDYLAYSYLLSSEWQAVADASPESARTALARYRSTWREPSGPARELAFPTHRRYDTTQWLPNVFLEKSDRASMLSGVEVRVPYLDPVVARAAMGFAPRDSRKAPLRDALVHMLPEVRLPERKMGLSVDIPRLMTTSGLDRYAQFALSDPASVLRHDGLASSDRLMRRAALNPTLAFRLGMLGLWQHEVLETTT